MVNTTKLYNNKYFRYTKISGLVLVPLVLLALPANFFDTGQPICLSVLLADMECYACGMTRGIMHLIHFEFETAWGFNKLVFAVFPIIAVLWALEFFKEVRKMNNDEKAQA